MPDHDVNINNESGRGLMQKQENKESVTISRGRKEDILLPNYILGKKNSNKPIKTCNYNNQIKVS